MRGTAPLKVTLLALTLLFACGPRHTSRTASGPQTLMDFLQAYNAYSLAQLYLKDGRYAEAIVEYEESLRRYNCLGDAARTTLREEYGLSQEQIERELATARASAQGHTAPGYGDSVRPMGEEGAR